MSRSNKKTPRYRRPKASRNELLDIKYGLDNYKDVPSVFVAPPLFKESKTIHPEEVQKERTPSKRVKRWLLNPSFAFYGMLLITLSSLVGAVFVGIQMLLSPEPLDPEIFTLAFGIGPLLGLCLYFYNQNKHKRKWKQAYKNGVAVNAVIQAVGFTVDSMIGVEKGILQYEYEYEGQTILGKVTHPELPLFKDLQKGERITILVHPTQPNISLPYIP